MPRAVTEFARSGSQQSRPATITAPTGKALNEAISALNAKRYDDARAAIGELRLDRLSPYERGKTEQVLFNISFAEGQLREARQHLLNAIESGGLTEQEIGAAETDIERIDARLAAAPAA
jgi:hypothetical protein